MIAVSYNFVAKIRISTLFAEPNAAHGQIRPKKKALVLKRIL
jgi:hypothetical protein